MTSVVVDLDDLEDVLEEAHAHLSYWNERSHTYDRLAAIVAKAKASDEVSS